MQAATHLAGAALTLAVARGFGLPVGPFEAGALLLGSLLPDIDTTTAGAGRYVRPLAAWIETRFGHRTVTHGLLFAVGASALLLPLGVPVALALLYGVLSHLLLDTMNVNGVPLLWPYRLQFWFLPNRSSRIRYGSPQETTLAVALALSGALLWPVGADGFGAAARRVVATPETAVTDYTRWRDEGRAVYVVLDGFNSQTQEKIAGRFRVIEALGRAGVLIEDDAGNALQVSRDGQVVAYRVRAYPGEFRPALDTRISVGGRLLGDVLGAVPAGARAYFTGELELSAPVLVPPAPAGTFTRVKMEFSRLMLHSARPADLVAFSSAYVVAGSLVVRLEGQAGQPGTLAGSFHLPPVPTQAQARTVTLSGLPSLAGVLVEQGAKVLEGQPLARYVGAEGLAELDAQAQQKRAALAQARAQVEQARRAYQRQRDALTAQLASLRPELERLRFLVSKDAEPRATLDEAQARARALESKLTDLSVSHAAQAADAQARADALALDVQHLAQRRKRTETAQVVRSPVAGRVAEVRVKDATQAGVSVEIVIISEVPEEPPHDQS